MVRAGAVDKKESIKALKKLGHVVTMEDMDVFFKRRYGDTEEGETGSRAISPASYID